MFFRLQNNHIAYLLVIFLLGIYEYLLYIVAMLCTPLIKLITKSRMESRGITINPDAKKDQPIIPGDVIVKNDKFYPLTAVYRTLGLGEAYMNGLWECPNLEEFFFKVFSTDLQFDCLTFPGLNRFIDYMKFGYFNLQTSEGESKVNYNDHEPCLEIFQKMLDKTMTYSCGYWKDAETLEQAQINKLDLLARKLKLKPEMRVLDIGCGWGGLCKYFAEKYQVEMVGCTISEEEAKVTVETCKGLPVIVLHTDYRKIEGQYDRIVSVEMFEHVGHQNYRTFFNVVNRCMKPDGIALIHTIGVNSKKVPIYDAWLDKYIIPNGSLPYPESICEATDGLFIIEDWQNIGYDYCLTLRAWLKNFEDNWHGLHKKCMRPDNFYLMWTYYLKMSAAVFRARRMQVWQIVLSENGLEGGYNLER